MPPPDVPRKDERQRARALTAVDRLWWSTTFGKRSLATIDRMWWATKLLLAVAVLFGVAIYFLFGVAADHNEKLDRNYNQSLRATAASCRNQLALGVPLGQNCLDPEITQARPGDRGVPLFDPNEKLVTAHDEAQRGLRVTCALAQNEGVRVPECGG